MSVFGDIVGHRDIIRSLESSLAGGGLSHAYLFHGPEGVGKRTVARRFAAVLVSKGEPSRRALAGLHPDVVEVEPEGAFTTIGQAREVVRLAASRPLEGVRRVFILRADTLNVQAANALLKTLEQPEGESVFLLLAISRESVLETIASRARSLRFSPVPVPEVEELLKRRGVERAGLWAALGRGSVGLALRYAEEPGFREMREAVFEAGLSFPEDFEGLHEAVERIAAHAEEVGAAEEAAFLARAGEWEESGRRVKEGARRARRAGRDRAAAEALELLALVYRDLAAVAAGVPELIANTDRREELEQAVERYPGADWAGAARVAAECRGQLTYNVTLEAVLEVALLRILRQTCASSPAW